MYNQARLPEISPDAQPHLFDVLGTVADFKNPNKALNRHDLEEWLYSNQAELKEDLAAWLPQEIAAIERGSLLDGLVEDTLETIDSAIGYDSDATNDDAELPSEGVEIEGLEAQEELGEEVLSRDPCEKLLDRLLYKAVLPSIYLPDRCRSVSCL